MTKNFAFLPPEWADEADSTNDELKRRLASAAPPPSGAVFAARRQTKGRGRMGNMWQSAESGDLTFSFVWKGRAALDAAGTLSLACGLAVRDFLGELGIAASCKWPNDIFAGGGKICGILLEAVAAKSAAGGNGSEEETTAKEGRAEEGMAEEGLAVVAGIGVNLRRNPERDKLLGRATSSAEDCLSRILPPEDALPPLLRRLESRITAWERGGFTAIRDDMNAALLGRGLPVRVRTRSGVAEGIAAGLGDGGELLVRLPGGELFPVGSLAALEE